MMKFNCIYQFLDFFRGYGKVRDVILKSGFGFVEFDSSRDAVDAVEDLKQVLYIQNILIKHIFSGRELCGDRVKIELSRRSDRRGGGDRFERGGRGDRLVSGCIPRQ